jgi:hypothetical protein
MQQNLPRLAIFLGLIAVVQTASAARVLLSPAQVKRDGGAVVTAEIRDIRPVTRTTKLQDGGTYEYHGFSFTLHVHEVLRGEADKTIPIAYSQQGYAGNWEFDRRPHEGMQVVAYLDPAPEDGKPALYFHPNAVEDVESFDDSSVVGLKKIFNVWKLVGLDAQWQAVKRGCFDENARFQQWCVGALTGNQWLDDGAIARHADAGEVHMLVQRVFADERTDFDNRVACDTFLCKRDESFATSGPRYDVFAGQLRTFAVRNDADDHNQVNVACNLLAQFPSRAEATFALLRELADRPEFRHRWTVLIKMHALYGLGPPAVDDALVAYLREKLVSDDEQAADGAAIAVAQIAAVAARAGLPVPEEITKLLENRDQRVKNPQVVSRLEWGRKEAARLASERP